MDDILDALAAEASNLGVSEATSIRNEQEQSLFGVQLKFANADKEMKRIFGVSLGLGVAWLTRLRSYRASCD